MKRLKYYESAEAYLREEHGIQSENHAYELLEDIERRLTELHELRADVKQATYATYGGWHTAQERGIA